MNVEKLALNIIKNQNGLYYSKSDSNISYPEEGNENFMQIEADSFWFNHRNNVIASSVKKHSAKKLFFDIGGGNGFVAKRLQEENIQVLLVEPGKKGATNAHKRGVQHVLCSTLEDAGFVPKSIDSIGLFDVVEHIEDDLTFLTNINQFMKDDGLIYITVPAYQSLWSNEDNDAGHFRRYTTTGLIDVLKKSGFSIVYATYIFSILPIPVFLFRSLPSKFGFNKNSDALEKHQNEHKTKSGLLHNLMERIWKWELNRVTKNKRIPFGGSCFVIGKKVTN